MYDDVHLSGAKTSEVSDSYPRISLSLKAFWRRILLLLILQTIPVIVLLILTHHKEACNPIVSNSLRSLNQYWNLCVHYHQSIASSFAGRYCAALRTSFWAIVDPKISPKCKPVSGCCLSLFVPLILTVGSWFTDMMTAFVYMMWYFFRKSKFRVLHVKYYF